MKTYEPIEHTADVGLRVNGKSLQELFKNAGLAIFDFSTERISSQNKDTHQIAIRQKAENTEELFINWLNELLSLSEAEGLVFEDFKIEKIENNTIEAVGIGYDITSYKVHTEIKAATYHQLKIQESKSGWQAEVIFDV